MIISSIVAANFKDTPLIKYLSERFIYFTTEQWLEKIAQGKIFCNNAIASSSQKIKPGDIIGYDMGDVEEPPADLNYSIVFEDQWLLGINKPGNLLVHHQGKSFKSNLIYQLRYIHNPVFKDAGIVNRLDRETSGVVIVAKNKDALVIMNRLLAEQKFEKEYVAVVHGIPEPQNGVINLPIGKMDGSKISYRYCINGQNAKESITEYSVIDIIHNTFSVVKLFPKTGRTHQLRVHLSAMGHVIVGDKLYGLPEEQFLAWRDNQENFDVELLLPRQALHCSRISFVHPYSHKECSFNAEIPDDMKLLVEKLKRRFF